MTDIRLIQVNDRDGNKRVNPWRKARKMVRGNLAQLRLPNIVQNPQKLNATNGQQWFNSFNRAEVFVLQE